MCQEVWRIKILLDPKLLIRVRVPDPSHPGQRRLPTSQPAGHIPGASTRVRSVRIPLRAEPEVVDVEATALVKLEEDIEAGPLFPAPKQ